MKGCSKFSMTSSLCQYWIFSHLAQMFWAQPRTAGWNSMVCPIRKPERWIVITPPGFKTYQFFDLWSECHQEFGRILQSIVFRFLKFYNFGNMLLTFSFCSIFYFPDIFWKKKISKNKPKISPKDLLKLLNIVAYFRYDPGFMDSL